MHITLAEILRQIGEMRREELWGTITGIICLVLIVRNNIWTWPWGLVSVVLFGIIFYVDKLFANAWLQFLYYLPIYAWGWWLWLRGGPKKSNDLPIARLSGKAHAGWLAVTVGLCVVIVAVMLLPIRADKTPLWPDPHPYADGITTGLSIVAQYMQARKWMENWALWVVANAIYTFYLFPVQHYYAFTFFAFITFVLTFVGWKEWQRILRRQDQSPLTQPSA